MNALIVNCSPVRTGATSRIVEIVSRRLSARYKTRCICIDDYRFGFCTGCRSCHTTARCVLNDDVPAIIGAFEEADLIVCVSPSYWADIPGQFKAFIDRCTPWCDTHEPHASLNGHRDGYVIALRTGPGMRECERIFQSIEHFYGHLGIECRGRLGLTCVESRADAVQREAEIIAFCNQMLQA